MRGGRSHVIEELAGEPVKENEGSAGGLRCDFDILPREAVAPTRLQRLERGFFCREACGIMLGAGRAATVAVGALGCRVHARDETRRAIDDFAYPLDLDDVYPDGNNHGRNGTLSRRVLLARA